MEEQQQSQTKTEPALETQFQLAVRERQINELLVRLPPSPNSTHLS